MKGKWSFPGGHQNPEETVLEATKREVKEETGYNVEVIRPQRPDYLNEIIRGEKHYIIVSSAGYVVGEWQQPVEKNNYQWFECLPSLDSKIKDEDCTPNLQNILNIAIENHFKN